MGNRAAYRVSLSRSVPEQRRPAVLRRLAPLLGRSEADLALALENPRLSPLAALPLAEDVGPDVVLALREWPERFAGVEIESHPRRRHPYGSLAAHLLGTVGEGGGTSGVEGLHDATLAGRPGADRLEVDSRGRVVRRLDRRPPVPGGDVRLTVDLDVQAAAEASLAERIAAARSLHAAPGGAVVAIECASGDVLALASAPTFDPAAPALIGEHSPLVNRVLQGLYAPGSTFKPVTALAGLAAGAVTPGTVMDDRGSYQVGGRVFRNAQGRSYGRVDLARALAVSSDVYFYALGRRLHRDQGDGPVQAAARTLGLGAATGVDIGPEATGRVPGPEWKRSAHQRGLFPDPRWYPGDSVNLAIGQGDLLVTPLQLAVVYAALANGGLRPRPHVTAGTASGPPSGEVSGPGLSEPVLTGLRAAVTSPEGTAAHAFEGFSRPALEVWGKTGTAERAGRSDTSLFAAVARTGRRCVSVVAVVEEAGFGSVVAAPVVRRVIETLFR
ncbi:MAG: penicillin-binding transpeptidase domain-containing protein [Actinomycetota bacterium]|nr:penicillin-binding transpeptidase domain-containing protein [Actinomycetota bacterium]